LPFFKPNKMSYYIKRKKKEKKIPLFEKDGVTVKKQTDLKKKLDTVFSLYIRLRDTMTNGMIRCISCGRFKTFDQFDCGHFHSRKHMSVRYDEDNCHAECHSCNRFSADHLIGYRANLIAKIGKMRVDKLEWKASQFKKWTRFELEELIKYYQQQIDNLKKEKQL